MEIEQDLILLNNLFLAAIYTDLRKDPPPHASYVAPLMILHIMQLTSVLATYTQYLHHLETDAAMATTRVPSC